MLFCVLVSCTKNAKTCSMSNSRAANIPSNSENTGFKPSCNLKKSIRINTKSEEQFTLGSTMNHVIELMGNPTRISYFGKDTYWYYKNSRITFKNNMVSEWSNSSKNLKVTMVKSASADGSFTKGSTYEQVIAVMGIPDSILNVKDEVWWYYSYSKISFKHGKVNLWFNSANNLKVLEHQYKASLVIPPVNLSKSGTQKVGALRSNSSYYKEPLKPKNYPSSISDENTSNNASYIDSHYRTGTYVRGYTRKDGTYVSPHYRSGGRVKGFTR